MLLSPSDFLTAALLAATLTGVAQGQQIDVRVVAETDLSVRLDGASRTLARGSDLSAGTDLTINDTQNQHASARVSVDRTASAVTIGFSANAATFAGGDARIGAHAIRIDLSASQPVVGHLLLRVGPAFDLDFGAGARREKTATSVSHPRGQLAAELYQSDTGMPQPLELEYPITLDSTGISLRADTSAELQHAWGSAFVTVSFRVGPGRIGPYGQACGAELTGAYTGGGRLAPRLDLEVSNAPPSPLAFLVFGTQALNIPIPNSDGSTCPLLTDILVPKSVTIDANGRVALPLAVPGPVDVRAQLLVAVPNAFGFYDWRTSNALHVRL